jgi:hypothetical protein
MNKQVRHYELDDASVTTDNRPAAREEFPTCDAVLGQWFGCEPSEIVTFFDKLLDKREA